MRNTYIFSEEYLALNIQMEWDEGKKEYFLSDEKEKMYQSFKKKYPELTERFSIDEEGYLLFLITDKEQIWEHEWAVDFLESNVNGVRDINEEGVALEKTFYSDLFNLFNNKGKNYKKDSEYYGKDQVEFAPQYSSEVSMETTGKAPSMEYYFTLKIDGIHWEA
tara:strand:- start:2530 stop:3021 length:492 start_codon:yes stop_codon:yes gene_type:complete